MLVRRVLGTWTVLVAPSTCVACYSVPDVVATPDGGSEAEVRHADASSPVADAAHDDVISPREDGPSCAILSTCANNQDCTCITDGVCAVHPTVAQDILTAAGMPSFCTKPCCTSADCPSGAVCFASGEGGNYCVNPAWIGRGTPSSNPGALGGTTCTTGSDCRSGLCDTNACQDTCCSAISAGGECAAGTTCVLGTFPGANATDDRHFAAHCAPSMGPGGQDATCMNNMGCSSGLCLAGVCMNPCRNTGDCGNPSDACGWDATSTDAFAHCFPPPNGSKAVGSTCTQAMDCQSYMCGPNGCTGVCFATSDCAGSNNWTCQPGNFLIGANQPYNVLVCAPP